jgi:hypothetical protein
MKLSVFFILTILLAKFTYSQNLTSINGITGLTGFWQFNLEDTYKPNDKLLFISSDNNDNKKYKYIGNYIPTLSLYKIHQLYVTYDRFNLLSKILLDFDDLGNKDQTIVDNTINGFEFNDLYDYLDRQFNRKPMNTRPPDLLGFSIYNFTWSFINSSATLILYAKGSKIDDIGLLIEKKIN